MMKIKQLGVVMAGLFLSACAHTPTNDEIKSQCRLEMETARTAVQLQKQGKSKQAILNTLPPLHPDSTHLLHVMYQSVDDTYDIPKFNENVYGAYRLVYCIRQIRHYPLPGNLQEISKQLTDCQSSYGKSKGGDLITCVRNAFPSLPLAPAKSAATE